MPPLVSYIENRASAHGRWQSQVTLSAPNSLAPTGLSGVLALSSTCRLSNGAHFELHALVLLNAADDLEQVASVGIPVRPEHAHQTLGLLVRESA